MTQKRHYDSGEERATRLDEEAKARRQAHKAEDDSVQERIRQNIEKHGA